MSAFVVQDGTINRVLGYLEHDRYGEYHRRTLTDAHGGIAGLGAAMRALNVDAVRARYRDAGDLVPAEPYRYRLELPGRVAAYKALACWLYQCAEGDAPEAPLYLALEALHYSWAKEIVADLPEYERAVWDGPGAAGRAVPLSGYLTLR
jgi:hypothetical protein